MEARTSVQLGSVLPLTKWGRGGEAKPRRRRGRCYGDTSHRECHIGGDFLLAYKLDDGGKVGQVIFVRAGTHAELFSE